MRSARQLLFSILISSAPITLSACSDDTQVAQPDRAIDLVTMADGSAGDRPGVDLGAGSDSGPRPDGNKADTGVGDAAKPPNLDWPSLPAPDWPSFPPPPVTQQVDILFVVDNSNSMEQEQVNLAKQFPLLIEALRSAKLGQLNPAGPPCTAANTSNCKLPDLHIGVISTDLGAGNFTLPSCEVAGGDLGKLQFAPSGAAGCPVPKDPYISYAAGVSNVLTGSTDQIQRVKEAFSCIAQLGTGGCGFEHPLESARRALQGCGLAGTFKCTTNPNFIRKDSFLAIIFVTDEDDCSAKNTGLFDPSQQGLTDPLGPLTSFRCFEFGFTCDQANLRTLGPKTNCQPGQSWLHPVADYLSFFKSLKAPQRLLVATIAGPAQPVEVGVDGTNPVLKPSCISGAGNSVPALRLKALTGGLGAQAGLFNLGISAAGTPVEVNICSPDFGPALKLIGQKVAANY